MLSNKTAWQLKEAGLFWRPALHDFFAVPVPGLSERLFVMTDMLVEQAVLQGWPAIQFNGAAEWALDYIMQSDAVWVPTDVQLRQAIHDRLPAAVLNLQATNEKALLSVAHEGATMVYEAPVASEAYAQALLALLEREAA